jgi:ribonuclease VapC
MVVDTSVWIAYLKGEPEADRLGTALVEASQLFVSTATLVETSIVVQHQRGEAGDRDLDELMQKLHVEVVPVSAEQAELARAGYTRFGKGRHPAALNLGDCFSYALARALDEPLLFVGDDFSQTDVAIASY